LLLSWLLLAYAKISPFLSRRENREEISIDDFVTFDVFIKCDRSKESHFLNIFSKLKSPTTDEALEAVQSIHFLVASSYL